jgi:hypothetical protein
VRVARADLDAVAEEIRELERAVEHERGGARDAYYEAVRLHADAHRALVVAKSVEHVRAAARDSARARYEIALARAVLPGAEPPASDELCFFDPAHGDPVPYWRSRAHAGYYGRGSGSLDDLLTSPLGLALEAGSLGVLDALIDTVNPFS